MPTHHQSTDGPTDSADDEAHSNQRAAAGLTVGKKLFFAALVVVGPVVFGELLCRMTGAGAWHTIAPEVAQWQESADGDPFWVIRGREYNRDGMRDREHAIDKLPEVHRIVCLGDSVTAGHGVTTHETYPFLFESFLGQLKLSVEVFNVAVSGWSTLQEVTAYTRIVRKYHPDQIFLGFCLNDVAEMHNNMAEPPSVLIGALLRHSALVRWLLNAKSREVGRVRELFDRNLSPAVEDGWSRVFQELDRLHRLAQADHSAFSVIIFPFRFQTLPDAPRPMAQERLFAWCRSREIPSIDMLSVLRRVGPNAFIDESHLSPLGARAVAEELIRWGRSGCMMCGHDLAGFTGTRCPRCYYPIE